MDDSKAKLREQLQALYRDQSKHSGYQSLPEFVRNALGYDEEIDQEWRGDRVRLEYILNELDWTGRKCIGDVGANTGFFTFSLAHAFAPSKAIAYEGNPKHALFMRLVADYFGLRNVLVEEKLMNLAALDAMPQHDILLLFNVLHHAGHDFDASLVRNVAALDSYCAEYLKKLRPKSGTLVFQMGSNWGGKKDFPIIPLKEDARKLRYFAGLLKKSGWRVCKAAFPQRNAANKIYYQNVPVELTATLADNDTSNAAPDLESFVTKLNLDQFVGEFYRRPIFICV